MEPDVSNEQRRLVQHPGTHSWALACAAFIIGCLASVTCGAMSWSSSSGNSSIQTYVSTSLHRVASIPNAVHGMPLKHRRPPISSRFDRNTRTDLRSSSTTPLRSSSKRPFAQWHVSTEPTQQNEEPVFGIRSAPALMVSAVLAAFVAALGLELWRSRWAMASVGDAPEALPRRPTGTFPFDDASRQALATIKHSDKNVDGEVFFAELFSNASNATQKCLVPYATGVFKDAPNIALHTDPDANTLVLEDAGCGMSYEGMASSLGTVPQRPSHGFHAVFTVAERVQVYSCTGPGQPCYLWESSGDEAFSITEVNRSFRGTRVVVQLKPEQQRFACAATVEALVTRHLKFVQCPVYLNGRCLTAESLQHSPPLLDIIRSAQQAAAPEDVPMPKAVPAATVRTLFPVLGVALLLLGVFWTSGGMGPMVLEPDFGVATMLLGSVSGVVALLYLLNHREANMQFYTWRVLSATMSIFCAVLFYEGFHAVWEHYFLAEVTVLFDFGFYLGILLALTVVTQVVIYFSSGAARRRPPQARGAAPWDRDRAKMDSEANATLLGHITGFASIHAFCEMQQLPFFAASPWTSALAIPVAYAGLTAIRLVTKGVRDWHVARVRPDGERAASLAAWADVTEEAEIECAALTVSFMISQAVQYAIRGFPPDHATHELRYILVAEHSSLFLLAALAFTPVFFLLDRLQVSIAAEEKGLRGFVLHNVEVLEEVCSMTQGWLVVRAITTQLTLVPWLAQHGVPALTAVGLIVTTSAFGFIWLFDRLFRRARSKEVGRAMGCVILATGISVGFTWEQAFEAGIETVAEGLTVRNQHWMQLLLSLFLTSIVVPAWKLYILPRVHVLRKIHRAAGGDEAPEGGPARAKSWPRWLTPWRRGPQPGYAV